MRSSNVNLSSDNDRVLQVQNLSMHYQTRKGPVYAVDDVSFNVGRGESLGLVGESGCGKTSIAISLLKLLPNNGEIVAGHIRLNDTDLVPLSERQVRRFRWRSISMVFQSAMNALNPVYTVEEQILEAMEQHMGHLGEEEMNERVDNLFELVGPR